MCINIMPPPVAPRVRGQRVIFCSSSGVYLPRSVPASARTGRPESELLEQSITRTLFATRERRGALARVFLSRPSRRAAFSRHPRASSCVPSVTRDAVSNPRTHGRARYARARGDDSRALAVAGRMFGRGGRL